jgi:2-keto-4-pentenoate hydratase/2-oxohepta-3-ene-1,7-dioic acid hydratase in catechol pathway
MIRVSRIVRYTLDPKVASSTPDGHDEIRYGDLDVDDLPQNARILPPCSPSKIVCVGRNYVEHAKELGNEVPKAPLLFLKPPSSLIGSGDAIVYPRQSQNVHFEGELGVVIGKTARHVSRESAFDFVRGFTCLNDVTARDIQRQDVQFTRGKGFDTFCAVGPWIIATEAIDLASARVQTRLNGEVKQDGPFTDMIFSIDAIIAYVAAHMTLWPGDLIATGTPSGVGPMLPGSVVEVEITGIGTLRNPVVAEE